MEIIYYRLQMPHKDTLVLVAKFENESDGLFCTYLGYI